MVLLKTFFGCPPSSIYFVTRFIYEQVDADYKLQDMKKMFKELEAKGKAYSKKLEDLQFAISKHMGQ